MWKLGCWRHPWAIKLKTIVLSFPWELYFQRIETRTLFHPTWESRTLSIPPPKRLSEGKWKVKVKLLNRVWLSATLWTVAYQAPPSMGFSRQEYWSGVPLPSPGDLPDPGFKPGFPALEADALASEPPGKIFWRQGDSYLIPLYKCSSSGSVSCSVVSNSLQAHRR